MDKKNFVSENNHTEVPSRQGAGSRERKVQQENGHKIMSVNELDIKASQEIPGSNITVSDLNASTKSSDVYHNMVIHYVDDMHRSEETSSDSQADEMIAKQSKEDIEDYSSDMEKETINGKEEESSHSETVKDSVSSKEDAQSTEDRKVDRASRAPNKHAQKDGLESSPRGSRARTDRKEGSKIQVKAPNSTPKKGARMNGKLFKHTPKSISAQKSKNMKIHPKPSSDSFEGLDDKSVEEVKDRDMLDEAQISSQSVGSENESAELGENGLDGNCESVDHQKIEEMESRIEKLEEELREVAAFEISLYSVVPEHGSSAHKVHTPARRLSRLYVYACKHWTRDKRTTVARNTVSGVVLVAKSCGNDVPRLTFWLSNTVVLREIICQAFGNSVHSSSLASLSDSNGSSKSLNEIPSPLNLKDGAGSKHVKIGFTQFMDDWQETRTFTAALEKVESWIFSRIVESVWWQTLTPHMQPPVKDMYSSKSYGKLLGPSLGDQQQGSFSINLWKNAFQDAFQRLCPVRAGGHECGCLPILARMVMEQCVARLDVAMFNAILRESADEIPTDPISDPIVDSRVLPIPAGDLSFGSGAQLKNSVGNWSRWLTDLFGMDTDEIPKDEPSGEDNDRRDIDSELKSFRLLNSLSDLLMLPKDMLMDISIPKEVCPLIGLPLVKRILCNFTPDDFCPDAVPGAVLEALNVESVLESRSSDGESTSSFPYNAAPVIYIPPSSADVAEKVGDAGGKSHLGRNVSIIQKKGYTSDDDLDDLDSPLTSIIVKMPSSPANGNGNGKHKNTSHSGASLRFELLREVWSL